ncbi:unnamed protein product [Fraxinus pennsylvanica]|uniref:Pentatricopeptide repeat-containing protein n=1 Tax=Fraxinus pennsylvanica TaxID=56036 RepID=A0AAD2A407_9LAMI|nr:unnamed protein product [Fraxinus pennsylvanica]
MRRRFTRISSLFLAVRNWVKFEHTASYINQHIQFPSRNATTITSTHILKAPHLMLPVNNLSVPRPFSINSDQEASSVKEYEYLSVMQMVVFKRSKKLEKWGLMVTPAIVSDVLSRVRNDWETAFTFFLWAGKQPDYAHSVREYHSTISILGKFRKFDTASALINDMRAASSLTPHPFDKDQKIRSCARCRQGNQYFLCA